MCVQRAARNIGYEAVAIVSRDVSDQGRVTSEKGRSLFAASRFYRSSSTDTYRRSREQTVEKERKEGMIKVGKTVLNPAGLKTDPWIERVSLITVQPENVALGRMSVVGFAECARGNLCLRFIALSRHVKVATRFTVPRNPPGNDDRWADDAHLAAKFLVRCFTAFEMRGEKKFTNILCVKYKISLLPPKPPLNCEKRRKIWRKIKILQASIDSHDWTISILFYLLSFSFFLRVTLIPSNRYSREPSWKRLTPPFGLFYLLQREIKWNRQSSDLLDYLVNSLNYCAAPHHKLSISLAEMMHGFSLSISQRIHAASGILPLRSTTRFRTVSGRGQSASRNSAFTIFQERLRWSES